MKKNLKDMGEEENTKVITAPSSPIPSSSMGRTRSRPVNDYKLTDFFMYIPPTPRILDGRQ